MSKYTYFILLLIFCCTNFSTSASAQERRFLTFYATTSGMVGHAFVAYLREDNRRQQTVVDGVWGFYPVSRVDLAKGFFVGEVPGQIRSDFLTRPDYGFTVEVNRQEYERAIQIRDRWANATYELTKQDCVSFVMEVAASLSHKLHLPERSRLDWPHDYIEALRVLNTTGDICPSHSDIVQRYDRSAPNYHMYTFLETICNSSTDPCCTEELVFKVMKSEARNTAPFAGTAPVRDCGQIDLLGFGPIVTKLGTSPFSITNYTKRDHLLHKGKVVRYIIKVGTEVKVYTVGIGVNKNAFYAFLNSNSTSVKAIWGLVNNNLKEAVRNELDHACGSRFSTLFLFDLSGSMRQNGGGTIPKIEQAKNASRTTLASMHRNSQGFANEVAIYGFEGACREDPTTEIFPFGTDLQAAEASVANLYTGGGTPLGKAIRAAECKLAARLNETGQQEGKLILLSDGQGTCGSIRPNGVYHNAPLQSTPYKISAGQCGGNVGPAVAVKYYTIGFNIAPGSPAERDLQYLSQLSGGKYLNAQNQAQLTRAFRKFNRVYRPKEAPYLSNLPSEASATFQSAVANIKSEDFVGAQSTCEAFVKRHPTDCHGVYNLALTYEANELYQPAISTYQQYLSLCPGATDTASVQQQIALLEEEFRDFVDFQHQVLQSDLEFLQLHFEKIQNGQSVALAMEFQGFLKEKGAYYQKLPQLIGRVEDKFFSRITQTISTALDRCANMIRRSPQSWDRDAIPVISMTYLNLKDLVAEM